jgi:hypothetical protein
MYSLRIRWGCVELGNMVLSCGCKNYNEWLLCKSSLKNLFCTVRGIDRVVGAAMREERGEF